MSIQKPNTEPKCPHCKAVLTALTLAKLRVLSESIDAVALLCPTCSSVLGTQFDQLSVQDIGCLRLERKLDQILKEVKKT
jgi:RNase P subunit RPR2